jgi:hypothetical protein
LGWKGSCRGLIHVTKKTAEAQAVAEAQEKKKKKGKREKKEKAEREKKEKEEREKKEKEERNGLSWTGMAIRGVAILAVVAVVSSIRLRASSFCSSV